MKREDINIRDPYVLVDNGKYYLYGTRSETCWEEAFGFDCYVSDDLENFEGPIEIFKRSDGFFATENYWAPECYRIGDKYYLVTTFGGKDIKKGIYVLQADEPTGPFTLYSKRLTPDNWTCIDGTLYVDDETIYLIFSHSFEDALDGTGNADGDFCVVELSSDLKKAVSTPKLLFSPKEASWAKPVPFAKAEFGLDGDCYFSDGPFFMKLDDENLYMIFSSWSINGYAVGIAVSESGTINGPWILQDEPLYPENGGHGMFFKNLQGDTVFTLHSPNDKYMERPCFWKVKKIDGILVLE
ncbi:Glycosyl hydrolases family 43 [Pseudobutyrivibrio ruminis]|uniref:Glycosyl hydrolases family 43 n=1 Tax=Pseudobutyrivibrio ruminis TaxID=46206 RepID=A0A1H7L3W7_9FIRM|nr:glycoside hydrolase family 43 protein [Pseudobutyrivibrio ruminis]SEK93105.1 Glycosyl hydrolases family 43 [Pseudobutyrivibrio ruminis]